MLGFNLRPIFRPILLVIGNVTHVTERVEGELDNAFHGVVPGRVTLALPLSLLLLLLSSFGADRFRYPLPRFLFRVPVAGLVGVDMRNGFLAIDILAQLVVVL